VYVVQTNTKVIQRCILMATDPGDLVLDPTCGSGTTATVAEQWGRRWITMDTSRVALALARARIMAAKYPFYLLADTKEGRDKEQEISGQVQSDSATLGEISEGFVYERAPHITLKSIANNAEIDVIWEKYTPDMDVLRDQMNADLDENWNDWDIPRDADKGWNDRTKQTHAEWWKLRVERQVAIDASIAQNADVEKLFDRPYENKNKVRVAGPFTVEALTPHRIIADDQDELIDGDNPPPKANAEQAVFVQVVLDNLKTAGVQQGAKEDRITLDSIDGWPGSKYISAKAQYTVDGKTKTAGIFVGPEFASVSRSDLAGAANEAADAQCDVLIACGFNFDVQTSIVKNMGTLHIIKAKINPDLHMARDLKNTGAGNLFVVFGEPDIEIRMDGDTIIVTVNGVDVFDPKKGKVRSDGREGIAAWFIDTDYNQESFFV
ncbi:MAG: site-specific DNA-methyltransferase, partial [Proteobacteria bacterium]|nr:site-specific DNA-methyltransferase [Pseudomonadota bacterium]